MSQIHEVLAPIICAAYAEPARHWVIRKGEPPELAQGRRETCYYYRPPTRSTDATQADEIGTRITLEPVNEIRKRVKAWRDAQFARAPHRPRAEDGHVMAAVLPTPSRPAPPGFWS